MPDPQNNQPNFGQVGNAFAWLTQNFGKTDAILIAGLLGALGFWTGWIPNPMMNRLVAVEMTGARVCVKTVCDKNSPDYAECVEKCWTGGGSK